MLATNANGIAGTRIPLNDIAERICATDIGISVDGNVLVARQEHHTSRIVIVPPAAAMSAASRLRAVVRVITPLPHELMMFLDDPRFLATANQFASLGAVTVTDAGARVESRLSILAGDDAVWDTLHLPMLTATLRHAALGSLAALGRAPEPAGVTPLASVWTRRELVEMERCLSLVSPCCSDENGFRADIGPDKDAAGETDEHGWLAHFRAEVNAPHPELGGGLSCTLEMPHQAESEHRLYQVCARLNELEMAALDLPAHFGAWTKGRSGRNPAYVSFYPNEMQSIPRLGVNAAFWALARARRAAETLPALGVGLST